MGLGDDGNANQIIRKLRRPLPLFGSEEGLAYARKIAYNIISSPETKGTNFNINVDMSNTLEDYINLSSYQSNCIGCRSDGISERSRLYGTSPP